MRSWGLLLSLLSVLGVFARPGANNETERNALLYFKNGLDDGSSLSSWKLTPVCQINETTWMGITCQGGHVVNVSLDNLQLKGTLPESWSDLTRLQNVTMRHNQLRGVLPAVWSTMPVLQVVDLAYNSLTGLLPWTWSNLSSLQFLDVGANNLAGTLPPSYSQLIILQDLWLGQNGLNGSLPEEWQHLHSLQNFDLGSNQLTGSLPPSWENITSLMTFSAALNNNLTGMHATVSAGTLPAAWASLRNLTRIDITRTSVTGTLPVEWAALTSLVHIDMSYNLLTGQLPTAWGNMTSLTDLYLNNNNLSGTLPASYLHMNLVWMHFYHNNLTGTLPSSWADLTRLYEIDVSRNKLTGTLPKEYARWTGVHYVWLYQNNFTGLLPVDWSNMTQLGSISVASNSLSGPLPEKWSGLLNVKTIGLEQNHFTGTVPSSWGKMPKLQELGAENNTLQGTLPPSWGQLPMQMLNVSQNNISGTLPPDYSKWSSLKGLSLNNNILTGTLPPNWWNLTAIQELYMNDNQLSGTIPDQWWNMTRLAAINLSHNLLTGSLPATWNMTPLVIIDFSGNRFAGPLPTTWTNLTSLRSLQLSMNNLSGPLPQNWAGISFERLMLSNNSLTGTVPTDWLVRNCKTGIANSILCLDLSLNSLNGSLPAEANLTQGKAANLTLSPMRASFGLCGPIPDALTVRSLGDVLQCTGGGSSFSAPAGWKCACPMPSTGGSGPPQRVVGLVAGLSAALLAVAIGLSAFFFCRMQLSRRRSGVSARLSYTAIRKLEVSSGQNLKFVLDKQGKQVLLGQGSYGEVYKARWHGDLVAVKVIFSRDPTEIENFKREGAILKELRYRHVVSYYDQIIGDDGLMLLITELMEGGDLKRCISEDLARSTEAGGPRQIGWYRQGRFIALGIARGLVYLHSQGVIWFDCKPSNVLLDCSGAIAIAKVCDFGLSKIFTVTSTIGHLRGTIKYMAPELLGHGLPENGAGCSSERSFRGSASVDIYSFGHVLWEIITGESYSVEEGSENRRPPRVPQECPLAILDMCLACLSGYANRRPSAQDVLTTIESDLLSIAVEEPA